MVQVQELRRLAQGGGILRKMPPLRPDGGDCQGRETEDAEVVEVA